MGELTPELVERCHRTLLDCSELDDHASLQAVFVTNALRPFQLRLPQANNKSDRVAQVLDFLVDKQLQDGRFISIAEFDKQITSLAVSGFVDSTPLIIVLGFSDGTIALYGVAE